MNINCDTMWTIIKDKQTITMKMCITTQPDIMIESNLLISLQNNTYNTTFNNDTFNSNTTVYNNTVYNNTVYNNTVYNIFNMTNNTIYHSIENNTVPSPSFATPSFATPSMHILSNIRGSRSTSPSPVFNSSHDNITLDNISPSSTKDESVIMPVLALSSGIILTFALLISLYKRQLRTNRIHSCTPLTSHYNYDEPGKISVVKPVVNTVTTNIGRPKDYIIEQLTMAKNSTPTTQRQISRPNSNEAGGSK